MIKQLEQYLLNKNKCPICDKQPVYLDIIDFNLMTSMTKTIIRCGQHYYVSAESVIDDRWNHLDVHSDLYLISKDHIKYSIFYGFTIQYIQNFVSLQNDIISCKIDLFEPSFLPWDPEENIVISEDGKKDIYLDFEISKMNFPISEESLISKIKTLQIYS